MALEVGEHIERYVIEARLEESGFGTVYRGRDTVTGEQVAVKCIEDERDALLEARTLASIEHDNIVHVKTVAYDDDGQPAIVMDWVSGQTLEAYLRLHGHFSEGAWWSIFRQLLDALHYLHSKELVHRDIKPANIMIKEGGRPVLIDLGASRKPDPSMTIIYSRKYRSPEARYADQVGAWTDIYSLAVVSYEAIHGTVEEEVDHHVMRSQLISSQNAFLRGLGRGLDNVSDRPRDVMSWLMLMVNTDADEHESVSGYESEALSRDRDDGTVRAKCLEIERQFEIPHGCVRLLTTEYEPVNASMSFQQFIDDWEGDDVHPGFADSMRVHELARCIEVVYGLPWCSVSIAKPNGKDYTVAKEANNMIKDWTD